jgi:hypothetical protein
MKEKMSMSLMTVHNTYMNIYTYIYIYIQVINSMANSWVALDFFFTPPGKLQPAQFLTPTIQKKRLTSR